MTPATTDPSYVGWVLDEAVRRGCWACVSTSGDWSVTRPGFSRAGKKGTHAEAATAILEATGWLTTGERHPAGAARACGGGGVDRQPPRVTEWHSTRNACHFGTD